MIIDRLFPLHTCTICHQDKSIGAFPVLSHERDLLRRQCQQCINVAQVRRRRANPNQKRISMRIHLRDRFGMTVEQYEAQLAIQNGVCAICHQPETLTRLGTVKRLSVDHCHATGHNRGLLCARCNVAIGHFRESAELLKAAITYLQAYQTK